MKVIDVQPVTMADAKETVLAREKEKELGYEQKLAAEHLKKFTKLKPEEAKKFMTELSAVVKASPATQVTIANILPQTTDEVRLIFAHERFSLKEEEISKILEIVKKFL